MNDFVDMKEKEYNGHPSHAHWNVALWFANDQGLYYWISNLVQETGLEEAIEGITDGLQGESTPDGVAYTPELVRYAIEALEL